MNSKNARKLLSKYNLPARIYLEFDNDSGINHVVRKNCRIDVVCNDNRCYRFYTDTNELNYYSTIECFENGMGVHITNDSLQRRYNAIR